jgi:acetyl-CoA carboxylase carboxyltransferase component
MHCSVSGSGHYLAKSEEEALTAVRRYLPYLPSLPSGWRSPVPDRGSDSSAVSRATVPKICVIVRKA